MSLKTDLSNVGTLLRGLYSPLIQLGGQAARTDRMATDKTLEALHDLEEAIGLVDSVRLDDVLIEQQVEETRRAERGVSND